MIRPLLPALLATALLACTGGPPPAPAPEFWPLERLVDEAAAGHAYVADSLGNTVIPMSAVVTPPGADIFFLSPPYASTPTPNTDSGPRLNVLPGLAEGRFTPYVTVEMWLNDFGPVWVDPLYVFVKGDGAGHPALDANGKPQPIGQNVFSTYVDHRFYSPFWRITFVVVPEDRVSEMGTDKQPKSVRDVLDSGWPILPGPLGLCPEVPAELTLDPALQPAQGDAPRAPLGGAWGAALAAQYNAKGLAAMSALTVAKGQGWWEGEQISYLGFGGGYYVELPDATVESSPIFMWVDRDLEGNVMPLGLPNVGGHAPLFSGKPAVISNGRLSGSASWQVVQVVRPAGAQPFFPMTTAFAPVNKDFRAKHFPHLADDAPTPIDVSPDVSALPGVERYAGRMAANPACFTEAVTDSTTTKDWATHCRFLDDQATIESTIHHDNFIDVKVRVLCPIVLWSSEVNE